jgi:hypothetical protein
VSDLALTRCRECRAEVALVRTSSGIDVHLDPEPLTPLAELVALMAGRWTFTRWTMSGDVHTRTPLKIKARPAGTVPRQDVHASHECTPTPDPNRREVSP